MILCFSGTGNSWYIAKIIASVVDDTLVSLNKCISDGIHYNFKSDKPFVIVCPTYAWQMPRVVEEFIKESNFKGNEKIYFVLTCGSNIGNAGKYAYKLAKNKKLLYMGIKEVVMPENFITMFKAPDREEALKIIEQAETETLAFAQTIKKGIAFDEFKTQFSGILQSSLVNDLFYLIYINKRGFYATDKCIGCEECVYACPLNNIRMIDNKPKWGNECTQCMGCIGGCPREAIEYKKKTQGKQRYYLEYYLKKQI